MNADNEVIKSIGDSYTEGRDGTLYFNEPKTSSNGTTYVETTAIANHTPELVEQRVIENGIETTEELVFNVRRAGRLWGNIPVTLKDIMSQTPNLKFGAACRIYLSRGSKARYSEAMQIQCETAPRTTLYRHTGYSEIDGKRVFLNGGHSITADGLTDQYTVSMEGQLSAYGFENKRDTERFETLLKLLPSVAPHPLIYTGLALSFLTPLNAILRDEGIEPCFILYFTGKTGARKTTMAKLFLNFFGCFDGGTCPPTNFRDTINAVEKKFALTDSTLVLLDDRIPSTTTKIKAQMEAMEQAVARQIGDRSGRGRMQADGTLKASYRPKCNLIITAEEAYSNVGESAIARSLSVDMKPNDIDLDALTQVQNRASHLNQCMGDYIQWVLAHWGEIQQRVKELFVEYRAQAQTGGHGRLAECVAHLQVGIIFMCGWLVSANQMNEQTSNELQRDTWDVFMKLAEEQNRRITEEKPVKLFIDAVKEMRDRKTIKILKTTDTEYSMSQPIGYQDADYYYFYPDSIYSEVRRFYSDQDHIFPLGKAALFCQMAIDGVIECDKEQTTKLKRINAKRPRLLWMRVSALDVEEEVKDNG